MTKSIILTGLCLLILGTSLQAQSPKTATGYQFTDITRLPATSVKDQYRAGTCWTWAVTSMLESEMLRQGKDSVNLSAMYFAKKSYSKKAVKYVRMHGCMSFSEGGAFTDVLHALAENGCTPLETFTGLNYGEPNHVFGELAAVMSGYLNAVIQNPNKRLSTAWERGFEGILDAYLGEDPTSFQYQGKEYTPRSFADEVVGLNADDYITLTSFTHHPFYSQFVLEMPDNTPWDPAYNLPIDELMQVLDYAIDNGYTFVWGSDVSEKGFASQNPGVAVVPTTDTKEMSGAEIAKWEKMPKGMKNPEAFKMGPAPEKKITQEMRQQEFDNYLTTEDHAMHIIGKAKDQNGTEYFIVKNSWNKYNRFGGYFYASKPFVKFKTIAVLLHKNALPAEIKNKLGIQ